MRQDKHKWQIGDVVYEASKSHKKVKELEIADIWIEDYLSGPKAIVRLNERDSESGRLTWTHTKFMSDIVNGDCYDTREEAEAALGEMLARKD
jgi:hypothetical protein